MTDERELPQGRLSRLAKLARVGARTGASLLLSGDGGQAAAQQAAEVLGSLRGLAAKGRADGELRRWHGAGLASRRVPDSAGRAARRCPTSSPQQIRKQVESELGAPIDKLFADWDDTPVASASIGQVHHRAKLPAEASQGLEVAVKVQHPASLAPSRTTWKTPACCSRWWRRWDRAISTRSDRSTRSSSASARSLTISWKPRGSSASLSSGHAGDPDIEIPQVIPERSARRVLTTAFKYGNSQSAPRPPMSRRDAGMRKCCGALCSRATLVGGLFNADPHPGNYLFQPEGASCFDFGCIQPIVPTQREKALDLHCAAVFRDEAAFKLAARHLLQLRGGASKPIAWPCTPVAVSSRCFRRAIASRVPTSKAWSGA